MKARLGRIATFSIAVICCLVVGFLISTKVSAFGTNDIGWFFNGSSWEDQSATYGAATNTWRVEHGSPYHVGSDQYSHDWNWGGEDADCGKVAKAPFSGTIIYADNVGTGYGKQVIIRSSNEPSYVWRAAHLKTIQVTDETQITKGSPIGEVGKTGGQTFCHLHSTFYKNIGDAQLSLLQTGQGLPNGYAFSPCETFSATGVVLFNTSQCMGGTRTFTSTQTKNLDTLTFNNKTQSIYIQPGWSVKIYKDNDKAGSTRCISGTMWNLAIDSYTDGTKIATEHGVATISSIQVFNNSTCTTPVDSMTFDSHVNYPNGTQIYVNTNFTKTWRLRNTGTKTWTTGYKVAFVSGNQMNGPAYVTLPNSVAPGATIDISVNLKTPGTTGIKTGNWALQTGGGAQIGNTFEVSIDVRAVPTSACQTFSSSNAVVFGSAQCLNQLSSHGVGFVNLTGSNNAAKSLYVPSGKSVRIYDYANRQGATRCLTGTMYNLAVDNYSNGSPIVYLGLGTISSLEVFNNTNCTPPASACPGYSSSSIVLFNDRDCRGDTRAFQSAGTRNLGDYSFEDTAWSIYVPSNLSLKVYEHSNKGGSSRCITGTMYNLSVDYYTSGNTGLVLAHTISSIEVFTNNGCTPPSNCPTYSSPGVVPFSGYECSGSAPYYYPGTGWWNLDTLNNNTRSLYVPSGKSVRLYEGSNRSGYTKCVNTTLYDMRKDYYNATSVPLVYSDGTANLSSFEIFDNSNCSPPNTGCSGYSSSSVVLFQDSNCAGDRRYFGTGFRNLPELDFNDKASSIYIPYGMSIKVFEHDNGGGSWSCYNTVGGLWDLYQDWYQYGNTSLRLNDTPSSIQVYSNRNCI